MRYRRLKMLAIAKKARRRGGAVLLGGLLASIMATTSDATTLADQPIFAGTDVPGNLALALSVEYPTGISIANLGDYNDEHSVFRLLRSAQVLQLRARAGHEPARLHRQLLPTRRTRRQLTITARASGAATS